MWRRVRRKPRIWTSGSKSFAQDGADDLVLERGGVDGGVLGDVLVDVVQDVVQDVVALQDERGELLRGLAVVGAAAGRRWGAGGLSGRHGGARGKKKARSARWSTIQEQRQPPWAGRKRRVL